MSQTVCPNWIAFREGKQGARSAEVGALVPVFKKLATDLKFNFKPSQEERLQMWKERFKNLLGNSSIVTD